MLSSFFHQARQKRPCQNLPWAISSKNMRREQSSLISVLTICGIALVIAWRSPSRYTDWHKSWGMTHWTRPSSTSREPNTICNKQSKRSRGHKGRDQACRTRSQSTLQRTEGPFQTPPSYATHSAHWSWASCDDGLYAPAPARGAPGDPDGSWWRWQNPAGASDGSRTQ